MFRELLKLMYECVYTNASVLEMKVGLNSSIVTIR